MKYLIIFVIIYLIYIMINNIFTISDTETYDNIEKVKTKIVL